MILTKFITKPCILPKMTATTKADALKELTHLLFEKRKLDGDGPALDVGSSPENSLSPGCRRPEASVGSWTLPIGWSIWTV